MEKFRLFKINAFLKVDFTEEEFEQGEDPQLEKAIEIIKGLR